MKIKSALAVAAVVVAIVGAASPAFADNNDISANMTIDNSTFESGELNAQPVAITFPLVTTIVGDRFYIDLPVGYVFSATSGIGLTPQNYDPLTGLCGTVETGVTVPQLNSGSYTCSTGGSEFPFEFVIQGNVPSNNYVVNFAAGAFRALTTQVDVTDALTISIAMAGDPIVFDDHGSVSVTTLGKALPNTGVDVLATVASGALAGLAGLTLFAFAVLRRRTRA